MSIKWSYVFINIAIASLVSLPFSIINFDAYSKGSQPTSMQFLASLVFIVLWFVYGIVMGKKQRKDIIVVLLIFWGSGSFLFSLGYITELLILILPSAIIFAGPLYGLKYILGIPSGISLVLASVVITLAFSLCGFFIGKLFSGEK